MTCVSGGGSRCVPTEAFCRRPAPGLRSAAFPCPPAEGARVPLGAHRRLAPPPGCGGGAGAAVWVLPAAACARGAGRGDAEPHGRGTRAEVDRLYEQAEKATEAYDKAGENAGTLRRQVSDAQDRIARQQD